MSVIKCATTCTWNTQPTVVLPNVYYFAKSDRRIKKKNEFLFHEGFMEILLCMEILRCLSKHSLYTKILRMHVCIVFIIKTPWTL